MWSEVRYKASRDRGKILRRCGLGFLGKVMNFLCALFWGFGEFCFGGSLIASCGRGLVRLRAHGGVCFWFFCGVFTTKSATNWCLNLDNSFKLVRFVAL